MFKFLKYLILLTLIPAHLMAYAVYGPYATSGNITAAWPGISSLSEVVTQNYFASSVTINNDVVSTGSVTATTLTDGTASINSGSLSSVVNIDASGTVTANKVTDGTASFTGGALSGATTGSFSDFITVADDKGIGNSASTERIIFDAAGDIEILGGNVGIGTTSPNEPLHVHAASGSSQIRISDAATDQTASDGLLLSIDGSQNAYFYNYENSDLYFGTNNDIKMTINSSGNVGIGTIGPDRKLDIRDASNPQMRLTHTDGSVYFDQQCTSAGHLYLSGSGGNVGIGTASPAEKLHIDSGKLRISGISNQNFVELNDGTEEWWISLNSDSNFNIGTSGSSEMFIANRSNGNVGIGTSGPDRKLDILDASNPQIRLTHTDGTVYKELHRKSDGVYEITDSGVSVADDGEIALTTSVTGIVTVFVEGSPEFIIAHVQDDGTVMSIAGSANSDTADTDTKLCVYDSGSGASVKNRLGDTKTLVITFDKK